MEDWRLPAQEAYLKNAELLFFGLQAIRRR